MIAADFLAILRCPLDSKRTAKLIQPDDTHLACERCGIKFPIRDGFPILIIDEAELPPGCTGREELACQRGA